MPNAAEKVNSIITEHGTALCDRCISNRLGLNQTQHAQQITQTLGSTSDFIRADGECAICKGHRKVTRRV